MWYNRESAKNSNDFLRQEALKYETEEDFIKALEAQGKIQYHGSPNEFDDFSYEFLGTQGTGEGKGFYFTNKKDVAQGYRGENNTGKLFEAYVNVKKPLSPTKKTITAEGLSKLIRNLDPNGQGFLSNYGDVDYDGYERILRETVRSLLSTNSNDVDLRKVSGKAHEL